MARKPEVTFEGRRVYRNCGYPYVLEPDGSAKCIHRLVMARHLGRPLSSDEVVHHRDGDKMNWSVENLEVMTSEEHRKYHTEIRVLQNGYIPGVSRVCSKCRKTKYLSEFYINRRATAGKSNVTHTSVCKACSQKVALEYAARDREASRQKSRIWREANRDRIRKRDSAYAKRKKWQRKVVALTSQAMAPLRSVV